jgi:uncharacterized repeat protein (TIGR03803 family)
MKNQFRGDGPLLASGGTLLAPLDVVGNSPNWTLRRPRGPNRSIRLLSGRAIRSGLGMRLATLAFGLMVGLGLTPVELLTAQPFISFNSDGAGPEGSLSLLNGTLYGTTSYGGSWGHGVFFAIDTAGPGFTNLHSFTFGEGINPQGGLTNAGHILFGTLTSGGSGFSGTVFRINTDGTDFVPLHSFLGSDGAYPNGPLVLSGNTLYGTASSTLFSLRIDGTGFTNLYHFYSSDGLVPKGDLILSGDTLYGMAVGGTLSCCGALLAVKTNGTGFTKLHTFGYASASDGINPNGNLVLSGDTLYGTALGSGCCSTIFRIKTDGSSFTTVHTFNPSIEGNAVSLTLVGSALYGTTTSGTSSGGAVFKLNTDGTAFTTLHSFTGSDGSSLQGRLILSDNILYGTAIIGGSSGSGTVFKLNIDGSGFTNLHSFSTLSTVSLPPPELSVTHSATNLIMTWWSEYANSTPYTWRLESSTNLVSPVVWTNVSSVPTLVGDQNVVVMDLNRAPERFYRLRAYLKSGFCIKNSDCPCGSCFIPAMAEWGTCQDQIIGCGGFW